MRTVNELVMTKREGRKIRECDVKCEIRESSNPKPEKLDVTEFYI